VERPATTEVRFRTLRTPAEIEALAPDWDALVTSARRPSPFLLASWVASWLREFGDQFDPCITVATRGDLLVGIAPFVVRRSNRLAHFVGGHESSLADLQLAPGEGLATAQQLLRPLAESGASALNAYGVPGDSALMRAAGSRLRAIPRAGAPVLEMPDGWEAAYERRTSKNRRSEDRRYERRLNDLGSVEITVSRDVSDVEEALGAALEIHRRRWQGRPDGSSFGDARRTGFMRTAVAQLAGQGRYGICLVRLDGRGVAFASWFQIGATIYGHRTAFDPEFSRFAPGQLAQRRGLAASGEAGATRVEFLGDADEYKRRFADRLDPMHQCVGLASGIGGHLKVARVLGAVEARKRLKKHERLHRLYRSGAFGGRGERAA
jgi:CelD/BcsL family acetyltransferase involved in cellulose biosynthesis